MQFSSQSTYLSHNVQELIEMVVESNNNLDVHTQVREILIENGSSLLKLVPSGKAVGYVNQVLDADSQSQRVLFISYIPNGVVKAGFASEATIIDLPSGHFEVSISRLATEAEAAAALTELQKNPRALTPKTLNHSQRIANLFKGSSLRLYGILSRYADTQLQDGTPIITKGYTMAAISKETKQVVIKESVQTSCYQRVCAN